MDKTLKALGYPPVNRKRKELWRVHVELHPLVAEAEERVFTSEKDAEAFMQRVARVLVERAGYAVVEPFEGDYEL